MSNPDASMTNKQLFIRAGTAGLAVGVVLLAVASSIVPNLDEVKHTSSRTGEYQYYPGRVGTSAYSTLAGSPLFCGASVARTYSQCAVATGGQVVRVDFVQLPTLFDVHSVAMRITRGDTVIYEVSPLHIRDAWIERSCYDALYFSFIAGFACYAVLFAFIRSTGER